MIQQYREAIENNMALMSFRATLMATY